MNIGGFQTNGNDIGGFITEPVAAGGRIMSSLANYGGLVAHGGIAGKHGGLAA